MYQLPRPKQRLLVVAFAGLIGFAALLHPGAATAQVVDLLKAVEPTRDRVGGEWTVEDGKLVGVGVKGDRSSRLQIPFAPRGEYQVTVTAKKTSPGQSDLLIGLVGGGRQFFVAVGPKGGGISANGIVVNEFQVKDESRDFKENVTTTCAVTRQGVFVWVDGQKFLEYRGDPKRLMLNATSAMPKKDQLFLGIGNDGRWEISDITIGPPVGIPDAKPANK